MKLSFMLLAGGVAGFTTLCDLCSPTASAATRPVPVASAALADTVTLRIKGMTCAGCTIATRKVLERLDGVAKADVSYATKTAVVTYDPAKVTPQQMIAAVATLEYTATVLQ